jgi:hypothetical protein
MIVQRAQFVQEIYPNLVSDFVAECKEKGLDGQTRIVCFPRDPKPHEVADLPWVQQHWV